MGGVEGRGDGSAPVMRSTSLPAPLGSLVQLEARGVPGYPPHFWGIYFSLCPLSPQAPSRSLPPVSFLRYLCLSV